MAKCSLRLTSNSNLEPYLVRSSVKRRVSFHSGQSPQADTGLWQARGLFSSFSDQVRGQERGVGNQCVFDTFVNCSYNKGFFKKQQSEAFIYLNEKHTEEPIVRRKNCMSNCA